MSLNSLVSAVVGEPTYARVSGVKTVSRSGLSTIASREQPTHASNEVYTVVQPTSSPSASLFINNPSASGSYTDFLIPNLQNKVQDINLCIALKNTSGVSCNYSGFHILNRVEYYSGSTLVCNLTPDFLLLRHWFINPDCLITAQSPMTNVIVGFISPTLAEGVDNLIIRVTGPFQHIVPDLLKEQLRIRLFWAAEDTLAANTGLVVTTPPTLLIESTGLSPTDNNTISSLYNSSLYRHRFTEPRVITETRFLSNSQNMTISLSNLNGIYSAFLVYAVRKSDKTALASGRYENVFNKIWITNAEGAILQGGSELTVEQHQYMLSAMIPNALLASNIGKCIVPLVFSHNFHSDLGTGSCHGVQPLYSQGETLHLVVRRDAVTSLPAEEFNIHVMGIHMSAYRIQDGRLISMR